MQIYFKNALLIWIYKGANRCGETCARNTLTYTVYSLLWTLYINIITTLLYCQMFCDICLNINTKVMAFWFYFVLFNIELAAIPASAILECFPQCLGVCLWEIMSFLKRICEIRDWCTRWPVSQSQLEFITKMFNRVEVRTVHTKLVHFTLGTMESSKYHSPANCQTQNFLFDCQT